MLTSVLNADVWHQALGDQCDCLLGEILWHTAFDKCGQCCVVDGFLVFKVGFAGLGLALHLSLIVGLPLAFSRCCSLSAAWASRSALLRGKALTLCCCLAVKCGLLLGSNAALLGQLGV